jgi:hypothetical protein
LSHLDRASQAAKPPPGTESSPALEIAGFGEGCGLHPGHTIQQIDGLSANPCGNLVKRHFRKYFITTFRISADFPKKSND